MNYSVSNLLNMKNFVIFMLCQTFSFSCFAVCREIQEKAVDWVDVPTDVAYTVPRTMTGFVFSKASDKVQEGVLKIKATERIDDNAIYCKMRNNTSINDLLGNILTPPMDDCLALNKWFLKKKGIPTTQIVFKNIKLGSGQDWVFSPIEYKSIEYLNKIEVSVPSVVTNFNPQTRWNVFLGVHYCKIVKPEIISDLLEPLDRQF